MHRVNRETLTVPVYLINLDRAPDRLELMTSMLSDLSLPFERVSAIDGRAIQFPTADFAERAYVLRHGRRRNPAEVGCYLSHIECARRLLASSSEHALVLEDDAVLPDDISDLIQGAIEAGETWDILRLSSVNTGTKHVFRKITPRRSLAIALTREKGSGAYVINRRAAEWFVTGLMPMRLPFDIAFDLEYFAGLKAAFVVPVPVIQDIGLISQIQGHRRAFHLSRWHYLSVQPYRAWLEITRLLSRSARLLSALARDDAEPDRHAYDRALLGEDRYLPDMAVSTDQHSRQRRQGRRRA